MSRGHCTGGSEHRWGLPIFGLAEGEPFLATQAQPDSFSQPDQNGLVDLHPDATTAAHVRVAQ